MTHDAPSRSFGIAGRLNLLIITAVLVTIVLIDGVMLYVGSKAAFQALIKRGGTQVRMLGDTAEYALFSQDQRALDRLIEMLEQDKSLDYAEFYTASGSRIGQYIRLGANPNPAPPSLMVAKGGDDVHVVEPTSTTEPVDFVRPVFSGTGSFSLEGDVLSGSTNSLLGFVRIGINQHLYLNAVYETLRATLIFSAIMLGMATALTLWITRRIVAPLCELSVAARNVAEGHLDVHVKSTGQGEVAELASAFRRMIENLRQSRVRIREYQTLLEDKVKRRTEELQTATRQAMHMAYHDTLTGLPNRARFMEELTVATDTADASNATLGVLFIDLDRFKRINDTMGHGVGDHVLRHVAERLRHCVRGADLVARFGGDEFVILVRKLTAAGELEGLAERLLATFEPPIVFEAQEFTVGLSIGMAVFPRDGVDPGLLLKHADIAMYAAKEEGRGNYRFFEADMTQRIIERIALEDGLERALERGEFFLEYQPQLDLFTGEIVGAEALLRWNDPLRGRVPPSAFIPLAESSGLIVPIGEWVLTEACRQTAHWIRSGVAVARVSVNISAMQFDLPDFVDQVASTLTLTGLPPHALELELTETVIVHNADQALVAIERLKRLGVNVALDDFGTGYSSLSYLSKLPIDVIKIDRSFILSLFEEESARTIVRSIIALAGSLNRKVIAEGVETAEQIELLRSFGCDEIQGYFVSRPCSPDALQALCASSTVWIEPIPPAVELSEEPG